MEGSRNIRRSPHLASLLEKFLRTGRPKRGRANDALVFLRNLARQRSWEAYMFGGVPRSFWMNGIKSQVRDFDLVFSDEAFSEAEEILGPKIVTRNSFGGLKLCIDKAWFDIWSLSKTWAFREGLVRPVSFATLPLTTFLNIDSLIIELAPPPGKKRTVYEHGFFKAWRTGVLDICLEDNPYPALCVVRSLKLAQNFGLNVSGRLFSYFQRVVMSSEINQMEAAQKKHYGRIFFTNGEVEEIVTHFEYSKRTAADNGIALFEKLPEQIEIWNELEFLF